PAEEEEDDVQFEVVKKGEGIKTTPSKARPHRDEEETEDEPAENDTGFEVVDDEEEERPSSRGIKERPSARRDDSEEEEDDRPSRRSSRARKRDDEEDEDEDDRPRKRRRKRPQRSFVKPRPNYRAHNGIQLLLYSIGTMILSFLCCCPILSALL